MTFALFLAKSLIEQGIEGGILANDGLDNLALGINEDLCGEALDAVSVQELSVVARTIDVEPGQLMLLHGSFPLFLRVIAVDTEDLELALILIVVFLHLGEAFDAPNAPGAPEVEDHILTTQTGETQRFAVEVIEGEVGSSDT